MPVAVNARHSNARELRAGKEPFPWRSFALIVGFALVLRLLFSWLIANTYDYDEFVILQLGRAFAHGAVPYAGFAFYHPPGILFLMRALSPITDLWWPAARVLSSLVDAATAGLVFWVGLNVFDKRRATLAGVVYAVSPVALLAGARVNQDVLLTFFGMLGLAVLIASPRAAAAVAAGVCLALALWIKYPAALFLPVYALAAPRRVVPMAAGFVGALAALLATISGQLHAFYHDTVAFQQHRWSMKLPVRLETLSLYWLVFNPLAVAGAMRYRRRVWLVAGFVLGGAFVFASQVYYHYFVPIVPFAALLSAPVVAWLIDALPRHVRPGWKAFGVAGLVIALALGMGIDRGGSSPLYITAAHLSSLRSSIRTLDRVSRPGEPILADRLEYAYLARRPELNNYFWSRGPSVNARHLEAIVPRAEAVVLSRGASSGYPRGFVPYLDHHFRVIARNPGTDVIWRVPR
ncbi:MAG: ArnT family glycosyltransferase [Chloroflexota bacterium]